MFETENITFKVSTSVIITKLLDPNFHILTKEELYNTLCLDTFDVLVFKKISKEQYQCKYDKKVTTNGFPNSVIFELLLNEKIFSCKIFSAEKDAQKKGRLQLLGIQSTKELLDVLQAIYTIFGLQWKDEYLDYTCSLMNKNFKFHNKLHLQNILNYINSEYSDQCICNWEPQKYQTINISIFSPNVSIFVYQTGSIDIRAKQQDAKIENILYAYNFLMKILDTNSFNLE